jgi:predicted small secreted protein
MAGRRFRLWTAGLLLNHALFVIHERKIMVRKFVTLAVVTGALALAACNTVRGVGSDIGSAANATENAMH